MKIVLSCNRKYNSRMILSLNGLKEQINNNYSDYEFVQFLWSHLSNNPNIIVGLIEIIDNDKYCFKYRFLGNNEVYSHTYTLEEILMYVKRRCLLYKKAV